ncbi:MAG: DUF4105 domain-containing protein, partial [Advenella sp.]
MIVSLALLVIVIFAWGTLALWVQFVRHKICGGLLIGLWALVSAFFFTSLLNPIVGAWQTVAGITFVLAALALVYWWRNIRPSNNRHWMPEVARQAR